ncbi:MAG: class I SAM-dependent methyltransferase [Lachnospiraceae bacterium]|nr:class I SAM-dependent methyltransferase [Lachnospiraceae bacterium]
MKAKDLLYRWKRYAFFAFQYFFLEKPRGLDFTMRDLDIPEEQKKFIHGYSKTNERHLRNIFDRLPFMDNLSLLDVGCGKGVVLKEAARYPFDKIAGIDINFRLIERARINFKRLHLEERIWCEERNALEFEDYGKYNVFFFFNPFGREIMETVIDKILASTYSRQKRVYLIYHNPIFKDVIEKKEVFLLHHQLYDSLKQYETYIYITRTGW